MTIGTTVNSVSYAGNGSASEFAFAFQVNEVNGEPELLVIAVEDATGEETELDFGDDFDVDGLGDPDGGNVTLVDDGQDWVDADGDLDTGWTLWLIRAPILKQSTSIRNLGSYAASLHEAVFDRLTMIAQYLQRQIDRAPKFARTSSTTGITWPEPEAGMAPRWNEDGDDLENYDPSSSTLQNYTPPANAFSDADNVQDLGDDLNPRIHGDPGTPTAVVAGTALTPDADVLEQTWFVEGSGGAVSVSANPQIAAGNRIGQKLRLYGCSDTNTIAYAHGTGLKLRSPTLKLGIDTIVDFFWNDTDWVEEGRVNDLP